MPTFPYDPDLIDVVLRDKSGNPLIGVVKATGQMIILGGSRGRQTGLTAAATLLVHQVGPADASFDVRGDVTVTTATSHSFNIRVDYTDESGAARQVFWDFATPSGYPSGAAAITNGNGAIQYCGSVRTIRAKANTTITIATVGTFTTVTYNADASVQLQAAA